MAESKGTTAAPVISARELVSNDIEYCTVYLGTGAALIAAGLATSDQLPAAQGGTRSGGFRDFRRNPQQRWKVRRRGQDQFEVYHWHQPRPTRPAFERFMRQAIQPAA